MVGWAYILLIVGAALGLSLVEAGDPVHVGGTAGSAYPLMLPSGNGIAYYMAGDIWLLNLETLEKRSIISHPTWESRFAVSPDGETLLFTSERIAGGRTIVCMATLEGVELSCLPQLADITYVCGPQSWVSGESFLLCGMEPERGERSDIGLVTSLAGTRLRWKAWIWEVSKSGQKIRTMTEYEGLLYAVWGRGGKILYTSTADNQSTIWLLDTLSGEHRPLIVNAYFPAWSPDGELIAFVRDGELWIASKDASVEQQLTHGLGRVVTPTWSSDGSKILFARFPPLDNDREAGGIYYVSVMAMREPPYPAIVSATALAILLLIIIIRRQRSN
jgi:WD40 repeat protein